MEFLPVVGLVLGVYAAFVMLFFRFLSLTHKKERAVVHQMANRR